MIANESMSKKNIYIMYIAWTIEIVPKHCFRIDACLCLIEMKRELHRTTKHEMLS